MSKMIVREGFAKFADIHIAYFETVSREVPVHFVGSVGAIFHELLEDVLAERGMNMGQIMHQTCGRFDQIPCGIPQGS